MTSEEAVRRYLSFLADPSAARDEERIADLERRIGETTDPIEKIKLASELYRAQNVDGSEYRDAFVAEAKARGIAPVPLRATLYTGQSVKTDKRGWYLRRNQSLAIGENGEYYILTVPGGLKERLRGVQLKPSPPPLYIGKGGRDGETGDLAWFLEQVLARANQRRS